MGIAEGLNLIANQALLNVEAPADQKGVSFGLYRTFSYLGAILSGSQLKVLFHTGINQEKFHLLSYTAFYSSLLLVLLLLPMIIKRPRTEAP
jgi:sugar phosphate permease